MFFSVAFVTELQNNVGKRIIKMVVVFRIPGAGTLIENNELIGMVSRKGLGNNLIFISLLPF